MRFIYLLAICSLFFTACSKKTPTNEDEIVFAKKEFIEENNYSKVAHKISVGKKQERIKKNDLKKVYFDYGTAYFKIEYRKTIKKHSQFMLQNGSLKVLLQGNADIGGQKKAHTWLAYNRANRVKEQLIKFGVDESRITISTNSSDNPVKLGSSEDDWKENRRVDFIYY